MYSSSMPSMATAALSQIFSWLNVKDVLSCRSTCQIFDALTRESHLWIELLDNRQFLLRPLNHAKTRFPLYHERLYRQLYLKYRILSHVKRVALCDFQNALYCPSSYNWKEVRQETNFLSRIGAKSYRTFTSILYTPALSMCVKAEAIFPVPSRCPIQLLENVEKHPIFDDGIQEQLVLEKVDKTTDWLWRSYRHTQVCMLQQMVYASNGSFHLIQHSVSDLKHEPLIGPMMKLMLRPALHTALVRGTGYSVEPIDEHSCKVSSVLQLEYTASWQTREFRDFHLFLPMILYRLLQHCKSAAPVYDSALPVLD